MKKLFLSLISILMLGTTNIKAQVNYEHMYTIPPNGISVYLTEIGGNNYKYVMTDYGNNKFSLYNLNHTPYILNVPIAVPTFTGQTYQIGYITSTLFDCDSTNVEYAIMSGYPHDTSKFMIYRTDGTLIFSKDSVTALWGYGGGVGSFEQHGVENTSGGAKLFLFNNHYQQFVYGLCGTLPGDIYDFSNHKEFVKIFPNPASQELNFEVVLPNNQDEFEIIIFNASGIEARRQRLSLMQNKFSLDVSAFSGGAYLFSLATKNKIYQSGKFVLEK
jgi:hypothetical protein